MKTEQFFKCPKCGKVSWNENDIKYQYCSSCNMFFHIMKHSTEDDDYVNDIFLSTTENIEDTDK